MSASPTPNGTAYQRHPFRRQGSSYGHGRVHDMAVIPAHQKLDYSVTKGGFKTWAVLIVFVLLCSALFAVFSESDQLDDDIDFLDESESEPTIEPQADPEEEPQIELQEAPPDIDDEENDDEEESLFATLRAKVKETIAKKQHSKPKRVEKRVEPDESEEDLEEELPTTPEPEPRHIQRRKQRQLELERKRLEEEEQESKREQQLDDDSSEDDDDSNESDQDDSAEVDQNGQNDSAEIDQDDSSEEDDDDEPEPPKPTPKPVPKQEPKSVPKQEPKSTPKPTTKQAEIDDEDDDDDSSEEILILPKQLRTPRKTPSGISWHRSVQSQQMAKDEHSPRMSLLKGKNRKFYPKLQEPLVDSRQESEENEDSNEIDDEELARTQIKDVTTTRKRTNFYNRKAITNKPDFKHHERLDSADFLLEKHEFDSGIKLYKEVLSDYRDSPRAHFGIGRAYQLKGEYQASDQFIDSAINEFQEVLDNYETPDELFKLAAEHLIACARFRGNLHKVMTVQRELVDKFPDELDFQTNFGITFLMMGRPEDARTIFTTILEIDPQNPVAQAYYGYLLKVHDQDYEKGVQYMRKGLRDQDEPIQDPKFYFHLGDGLMRLGRNQDAFKVYEEAVELGLFPSVYQRSTYNLDGLTARPWWTLSQTRCSRHLKNLERHWTIFREEALHAWNEDNDLFVDEDPHITTGYQRAFWLRTDATFNEKNCKLVPTLCQTIKEFAEESNCDKGNIKISVMQPGTRVWPSCAPTNFILDAQLGLISPSEARIRVGKEIRGWKTGKFLIYDKSFEHETWFDGASSNSLRMILSIELWHPEVPLSSRVDTVY